MSTKATIADVITDDMFVHIYQDRIDSRPWPVHIEMWERDEFGNRFMAVAVSRDDALRLVDDLSQWAMRVQG